MTTLYRLALWALQRLTRRALSTTTRNALSVEMRRVSEVYRPKIRLAMLQNPLLNQIC